MAPANAKIKIIEDSYSYGGKKSFRWELMVRGKVLAESSSEFSSRSNARRNAESTMRHAASAVVVDE